MHVTPSDLRTLRQDGTVIRFALLDSMAFVLAELPASGSARHPARSALHPSALGVRGRRRGRIRGRRPPPASAPRQRIPRAAGRSAAPVRRRRATPGSPGSNRSTPSTDTTRCGARGPRLRAGRPDSRAPRRLSFRLRSPPLEEPNRIEARSWSMSQFVLTRPGSGPAAATRREWCDAAALGPGHFRARSPSNGRTTSRSWPPATSTTVRAVRPAIASRPPTRRASIDLTPIDALTGRIAGVAKPATGRRRSSDRGAPIAVAGLG